MSGKMYEKRPEEDARYHDTWRLLKKSRDVTWSLELYQQTNARLWRQGQTADTVVIQHIIVKGTIDEQIMKALKTKDTTQAALITAVKAEVHK